MRHLLLQAQAWWDSQRFDQPMWHVTEWRDQKVRHIQLHVAKALGKVVAALGEGARAASGMDSTTRVRDEVLPDVAIYRSQLINAFGATVSAQGRQALGATVSAQGEALLDWDVPTAALDPCSARAGAGATEPLFHVVLLLGRASAQLAAYIEPREHGVVSPAAHIRTAIQDLHTSAEALAAYFAVDLVRAHRARLEALLGAPLPASVVAGAEDVDVPSA